MCGARRQSLDGASGSAKLALSRAKQNADFKQLPGDSTDMSLLNYPFDTAREAALVTGAGNGIGRAIAQALVGEGVRTVFADVNEETLTAAIKTSPRPELALPWVGDLADPAARDGLLAEAARTLGRVTHFVHSASPPRRE